MYRWWKQVQTLIEVERLNKSLTAVRKALILSGFGFVVVELVSQNSCVRF
jgi:hypothetical protein